MSERTWSIDQLQEAVKKSKNHKNVLRLLNLKADSSHGTIKKYIEKYQIDISHFENHKDVFKRTLGGKYKKVAIPLIEILVEKSTYNRTHLKNRLYKEGLKKRICELCGQNENWHGKKMSLILDHINGINNDNRLFNIRIVCPNCAATLETHCAKNIRKICIVCGTVLKYGETKYCSMDCYHKDCRNKIINRINYRKVDRPPFNILKMDIENLGFRKTGKKYGVSDNSIRKWIKFYNKCERIQNLGV
jgi:hypothetical protein